MLTEDKSFSEEEISMKEGNGKASFIFVFTVLIIFLRLNASAVPGKYVEKHWSYEGSTGPAKWGMLMQEFQACIAGKKQSPIDIKEQNLKQDNDIPSLSFAYFSTPLNIFNNGHTIQVNYERGSKLTIAHDVYELSQFDFHRPSEHAIEGKRADMEVHFVHRKEDGTQVIIAILMKKGFRNKPLEKLFNNLPGKNVSEKKVEARINALDIFPQKGGFYTYSGSLTHPPCLENVTWYVLKNPIELSAEQLNQFSKLFQMNVRPLQKLEGRIIEVKD